MNQDEIIRMAREAGLEQVVSIDPKNGGIITKSLPPELLERFATLVAAHEREACAYLRKEIALNGAPTEDYENGFWDALEMYETAIRARGEK